MVVFIASILIAAVLLFLLWVRPARLADETEAPALVLELEARKRQVYESLRDLHFEHRLGKLSEEDYNKGREALHRELERINRRLAALQAQTEEAPRLAKAGGQQPTAPAPHGDGRAYAPSPTAASVCPHCGAEFPQPLKYCGECGKPMSGVLA